MPSLRSLFQLLFTAVLVLSTGYYGSSASHAAIFDAAETLSFSNPISDDLYAAGGQLTVDQAIAGDAFLAGGVIKLSGDISQDLMVVGGYVTLDGNVGDDVRAAGGDVTINGSVQDDLIITGGTVLISEGVTIGGDVIVSGGRLRLNGNVNGNLIAAGGILDLNGDVSGDLTLQGGLVSFDGVIGGNAQIAVDQQPTFGPNSAFNGNLTFWTPSAELELESTSVAGSSEYDASLRKTIKNQRSHVDADKIAGSLLAAFSLYWYFSHLLILLIAILATKNFFFHCAKKIQKQPFFSAFIGLCYFVLTPVLAFLVALSLIGAPLAFLTMVIYFISIYLAPLVAILVVSYWLATKYKFTKSRLKIFGVTAGVLFMYMVLGLIPFLGWLVQILLACMGFGSLLLHKQTLWDKVL